MSIGLDPGVTPDLYKGPDTNNQELPIETIGTTDKTAYLKINLKIDARGGKEVRPMTAVFAPDPSQITGETNILLWFHGDKNYWQADGQNSRKFPGESIQFYLNNLPMCKLREFILKTSQKKFLLVAPTLNDRTGISVDSAHGNYNPGALTWDAADADAYLQQVLKGANKHLGTSATKVGNIVLAGHSGGGHLQGQMASQFGGIFNKVNEVWCFDSTYWGSSPFINWAGKGHSNPRLWVYATKETTAKNALAILNLTKPAPPPRKGKTPLPANPASTNGTKIEVLIDHSPIDYKPAYTDGAWAAYSGGANGHYEGMPKYLPTLVGQSQNLK